MLDKTLADNGFDLEMSAAILADKIYSEASRAESAPPTPAASTQSTEGLAVSWIGLQIGSILSILSPRISGETERAREPVTSVPEQDLSSVAPVRAIPKDGGLFGLQLLSLAEEEPMHMPEAMSLVDEPVISGISSEQWMVNPPCNPQLGLASLPGVASMNLDAPPSDRSVSTSSSTSASSSERLSVSSKFF
jgi:hypothetical protein